MSQPPPDIESLLVEWLASQLPDNIVVVTDLGTLFDGDSTPLVVQVNALPGSSEPQGWNGLVPMYRLDVDIDFFAPDRVSVIDLSRQVTSIAVDAYTAVSQYGRVSAVDAPPASRRPDYNQRVSRYGAVWSLTVRS